MQLPTILDNFLTRAIWQTLCIPFEIYRLVEDGWRVVLASFYAKWGVIFWLCASAMFHYMAINNMIGTQLLQDIAPALHSITGLVILGGFAACLVTKRMLFPVGSMLVVALVFIPVLMEDMTYSGRFTSNQTAWMIDPKSPFVIMTRVGFVGFVLAHMPFIGAMFKGISQPAPPPWWRLGSKKIAVKKKDTHAAISGLKFGRRLTRAKMQARLSPRLQRLMIMEGSYEPCSERQSDNTASKTCKNAWMGGVQTIGS